MPQDDSAKKTTKKQLKLNDLIFKDGSKELTTGAKIGAGVLAGGGAILLAKLKSKKQKDKGASSQTDMNLVNASTDMPKPPEEGDKPKSKTMLYVGLGVGAVLIIGAVFFMTKKKA